jgi:hypothetical protein
LALAPPEPQWAHVSLQVTSRGLTTGAMPAAGGTFEIDFDFVRHQLEVRRSDGRALSLPLVARPVAAFYALLTAALRSLDVTVSIWPMPVEIPDPIRFTDDTLHAAYDPEYVNRFWRILVAADSLLKAHRAPFRGRHTPVQFFWGSFDLAYARYSGRAATPPSGDTIIRKAMDAEEICAGFWPGDVRFPEPAFWCYAFPKPPAIAEAAIAPAAASWNEGLGEFILRYDDVRRSPSPREDVLAFFASTFRQGAALAHWKENLS